MSKNELISYKDVDVDFKNLCSFETENISEIMKKSAIQPGFEQQNRIANYNKSIRKLKKERKIEKEKSRGPQWFNLPSASMTPEVENDLKIIQMRSVLDSKHFYKKNDLKVLPKYFEVGRVVDSPVDYYHSRIPKKERKRTIVEELLADAEFQRRNKKKYKEIMAERSKTHYKAHQKAKRLKRNKK